MATTYFIQEKESESKPVTKNNNNNKNESKQTKNPQKSKNNYPTSDMGEIKDRDGGVMEEKSCRALNAKQGSSDFIL